LSPRLVAVYHRRPTIKTTIHVERTRSRLIDLGDGRTDSADCGEYEEELEVSGTYSPGEAPCDGMQWRQTGHGPQPSPGCDASVELDAETEARLLPEEYERAIDALLERHWEASRD